MADEERYNRWVRENYRFLTRSAWALTGSRAVGEDVVQDCFALAWKHRKQLRDPTLARAWLFRIMRRCALRHLTPPMSPIHESDLAEVTANESSPDDRYDIVRALARISADHREVLVLYYFDDMSTQLMAEALEIAPGTVLSRLARARDALKSALLSVKRPTAMVTRLRAVRNVQA